MEKEIEWDAVLIAYTTSGVTKQEFCATHQLPFGKFKYHWYKSRYTSKAKSITLKGESTKACVFEPVSITTEYITPSLKNIMIELAIHLPNDIKCNLKLDMHQHELPKLLQQLGGV